MPNALIGQAGREDVQAAYLLVLARPAESSQVVDERIEQPNDRIVADFLASDEFRNIARDAVRGNGLKHDRLSRKDRVAVVKWLDAVAPGAVDPSAHDWWSLLFALLKTIDVDSILDNEDLSAFGRLVADRAEERTRRIGGLQAFSQFDEAWYLRTHQKARLALASGASDSAVGYFLDVGLRERQQLLPFFAEGFEQGYQRLVNDQDYTFADVLSRLLMDAEAGRLSHWLFSRNHYRSNLRLSRDSLDQEKAQQLSEDELFTDFLIYGDIKGYNPHPLFSHHAYEVLNPDAQPKRGAFRDYVTEGCFAGRRTSIMFDDDFYLVSNADARQALLTGSHVSALHHFLTSGIYRDAPFTPDFDLHFYLHHHPDVRDGVNAGAIPSATYHFVHQGLAEQRMPNPYFNPVYYRQRHPLATNEMRRLGIGSEIEHFLLLGKARGYKPEQPLVTTKPAMDAAKAVFQRRARRSFGNLSRDTRDFAPFARNPQVSLIVPVFNEVEFTARFLDCAYFAAAHLKHAAGVDSEVIIVDNGSTDGTDVLLEQCPGLVIESHDKPIGFPRAVNAGVRRARGKTLIVANNDIEFAPDALLRMHQRLEADDTIGLLGGLTILPNETLQEAGSFLDSGAGVIGLGRNEDPWNQYFQGVHEADYCTGSFIGFRRGDYDSLGGFDEAFSPGYYEETDFSFRLLEQLGKRAAIDSSVQVTHFEHASFGKGRPPTTAYALIRRNQDRFVGKHRDELRKRPATLALHSGVGVRPLTIGRSRILVIEDLMPDTRLGSGFVRSSQVLAALTRFGVAYDLLVLNASSVVDDYSDPRVNVYRNWMPGESFEELLSRQAGSYSHVMVCRTHNLMRFGARLEQLRYQHGFKLICDTEALSVLRVLEMQRLAGSPVDDAARHDAIRLELTSPASVDHWIAVSPYEDDQITAAGFSSTSVICHHFPRPDAATLRPFEARTRVLAVGAVHEAGTPNHDGLLWFMDRIYPRCRDALQGLTLTLVGYWRPEVLERFAARYSGADIAYAGVVSDRELAQLYAETRIALAPTRFAAGVASKVLEPMMLGVPVVITDLLELQLVGQDAVGQHELAVGKRDDDGESFAAWTSKLATEAAAWARMQQMQYAAAMPLASEAAFEDGVRGMMLATGLLPATTEDRAFSRLR